MGSIIGAIADDERQYLERCKRYGEEPVHSAVHGYDVYGAHAQALKRRDDERANVGSLPPGYLRRYHEMCDALGASAIKGPDSAIVEHADCLSLAIKQRESATAAPVAPPFDYTPAPQPAKAIVPVRRKTLAVRMDYVNCVIATDAPIWVTNSDPQGMSLGYLTLHAWAYVGEVKEGETPSQPVQQIELLRSDPRTVKQLAQTLFDAIDTGAVKVDARSMTP